MKRTLNTLGKTLTAVAALSAVTANIAEAGTYGFDAAGHANKIIQHTPYTGHGWAPSYKPAYKPVYQPVYKPAYHGHLTHKYGHGVTIYDGRVYGYGYTPVIQRKTIIKPVIVKPYPSYHPVSYGGGYDQAHDYAHQTVTDIRSPIFFASGSSHLTPEAKAELIEIGQVIKSQLYANPHLVIQLSGFTDAKGSQAANLALAKSRNHRVKDFLIASFGFNPAQFSLRAVGEVYANASAVPHADVQRKVVVSLLGLPQLVEAPVHYDAPHAAPTAPVAPEAAPSATPSVDPGVTQVEPLPAPNWTASARCTLPTTPYGTVYAAGQVVGASFNDIDDYGGGQLIEYCAPLR